MKKINTLKISYKKYNLINYKFLATKFVNLLMVNGKKHNAENFFFNLLKLLAIRYKKFPFTILIFSLKNIAPLVLVQSVTIKRKSYQVPVPLTESKQLIVGMKWLIDTCRSSKLTQDKTFIFVLIQQIELAFQNKGELVEKKFEIYKNAKLGRPFASYRWF